MIVKFNHEELALSRAAKRFTEKGISCEIDMGAAFVQGQYVYVPFIEADEDGQNWLATCHITSGDVSATVDNR